MFLAAVADVSAEIAQRGTVRPELSFEDEPPPRRLAPQAAAFAATVTSGPVGSGGLGAGALTSRAAQPVEAGYGQGGSDAEEIGWGKFVLLFDPASQEGWAGPFRIIAYIRSELEPDIAADPLVGQVGWSWLTEALDVSGASYAAPSGTVTAVVTEGFGAKAGEPIATGFELRASWSPRPGEDGRIRLGPHLIAWSEALCVASGLAPYVPGVPRLRPTRPRHLT